MGDFAGQGGEVQRDCKKQKTGVGNTANGNETERKTVDVSMVRCVCTCGSLLGLQ